MSEKNKDPRKWKNGYTTGSCAAGAVKGACILLRGESLRDQITISLPDSSQLQIPVFRSEYKFPLAEVSILKDGGDDPDITNGIEIVAKVQILSPKGEIHIRGGRGVGKVTKKGLALPVGESAINPVPRSMINKAVREIFPQEEIDILIEVPDGERIAVNTLNPRLGIIGGISILGTSGIVRPMSEEAFKSSILPELDQAVAYGYKTVVLTPGHYGFKVATEKLQIPSEAVIQMSNFVGFILEEAAYREIKQIILLGHIGKLIKVAGGIFHTHNRMADARMEILLAHAALDGIPLETLIEFAEYPTIEGVAKQIISMGNQSLLHKLAHLTSLRTQQYLRKDVGVGTIYTLLDGSFIGWDNEAKEIIKHDGWNWSFLKS